MRLSKTVVESVDLVGSDEELVVHVRPTRSAAGRCGRCQRRAAGYDGGEGRRRWRCLDHGTRRVWLEADAPRVDCPEHGVTVAAVPWARHNAGHTRLFDQQIAWLVMACSRSAVTELMRVGWRTVGAIVGRVWAEVSAETDPFANLRRIGIDEVSYRRGGRYLVVVVDHDTGRVVWAGPGASRVALEGFFDGLGADRCALISHVSADGAPWIGEVVAERCPQAVLCLDPFHVVKWANEALDEVRRAAWNAARRAPGGSVEEGGTIRTYRRAVGDAAKVKHARMALLKSPEKLTDSQRARLDWIAQTNPDLHQAYLIKEGLRMIFRLPAAEAAGELDDWIAWAHHSTITTFVRLGRRITKHRDAILATIEHGLSNGRVESVNAKIELRVRMAYGFTSTNNLIALIMLTLGGHPPTLPGRK